VGDVYDSPDGEIVEKGGVAQQLRLANLLDNYASAPGTSTNPRNVFTCNGTCTAGSNLVGYSVRDDQRRDHAGGTGYHARPDQYLVDDAFRHDDDRRAGNVAESGAGR
jgi:hypothetical protein